MATYLSVLHLATAGLNGPLLGTDEEEIVQICFAVVNKNTRQVVSVQEHWIKPRSADINENVLSEQAKEELGMTEDLIRKGQPLDQVIAQLDDFIRKVLNVDVDHLTKQQMVLVTDGQLGLRQSLHPETCTKGIDLPEYYNVFYDLRKEFRKAFPTAPEVNSVQDMLNYFNFEPEDVCAQYNAVRREAHDMCRIIERILKEGLAFDNPEPINIRLEPGICSKDEEVDNNTVVRARGLPWQSSDQDIARFFRGLNVARGGVALCLSQQGRRNGEALVRFVSPEHRDMALKRHKHHIGQRYIEVYKASGEDFIDVAGGSNNEAQNFLSRSGQVIVRMRGLPYDCTAKQVIEFFESGGDNVGCSVLDGEGGVLFVKKHDGRATGDAFVMFSTEEEGSKALAKHRDIIGSRYIELFRSTTAEVQQVLNRSMDPRTYETQAPLIQQLPQMPLLPQQMITSGTRKDCIRLRGLPYEAQVEHILDFLGEHAKNIVYQGVHMVYNAQGQPSGEAFIQMDSEQSSFQAAQHRHHRYMVFGKKQRYIEVFQCSGEDMHLVLTGGLALPSTPATPKALLSPGMLPWDPLNSLGAGPSTPLAAQAQLLQQAQAQAHALQEQAQAQAQIQVQAQAALAAHALKQQEGLWLMGLAPPPGSNTGSILNRPPPNQVTAARQSPAADRNRPSPGLGLLGQGGVRPFLPAPSSLSLGMQQDLAALQIPMLSNLSNIQNLNLSGQSLTNPHHPLFLLGMQHGPSSAMHQFNRPNAGLASLPAALAAKAAAAAASGSFFPNYKRSWEAAFQQPVNAGSVADGSIGPHSAKRPWPPQLTAPGQAQNSSLAFPSSLYPAL